MNKKTMTSLVQEYLDFRRSLGFKLKIEGMLLLKFAAYADEQGHRGSVTTQLALDWACLPQQAARLYQARRLEMVRCFAKYQAIFDNRTEIPAKGLLGAAHRRNPPHIYSHEEISALMQVADTYWYLTGVPELMEIAGERFENFANSSKKEAL